MNFKMLTVLALAGISFLAQAETTKVSLRTTLAEKALLQFPFKSEINGTVEYINDNHFIVRDVRGYCSDITGVFDQEIVFNHFKKDSLCRRFVRNAGYDSRGIKYVQDSAVTVNDDTGYYNKIKFMECSRN